MLTKSDLAAIQKMFDFSKKETNERFDDIDKRFESIDKRFESMDERFDGIDKRLDGIDKRFDDLLNSLYKSTDELVELITIGFNSYEKRIKRIEEVVFKIN